MYRHGEVESPPVSGNTITPTTLAELQTVVTAQKNVRITATGHSGEPWVADTRISLNSFNRPLAITDDTITCEAGMLIVDVLAVLRERGRTIEGLPSILQATIGGVLATGAHGSGTAILASHVLHAVVILGNGSLISVPAISPQFTSVLVSAGLIGVLYNVTLRTIPDTPLYQQRSFTRLPLDPIGWLQNGLYRQLFYNPYTHNALLYDHSRVPIFGDDHQSLLGKWLNNSTGEKLATSLYENFSWLLPRFIDTTYQALAGRSSGATAEVLSIPEYNVPFLDYEVAVPVAQASQALQQLQQLIICWRDEHRYFVWFGIMLRWVKADNFPLSMAYGSDVITFALPLYDNEISREFILEVQQLLGTRFHIGKYFPATVNTHHGWAMFEPVRAVLDQQGKFMPVSK